MVAADAAAVKPAADDDPIMKMRNVLERNAFVRRKSGHLQKHTQMHKQKMHVFARNHLKAGEHLVSIKLHKAEKGVTKTKK
jgi:hypothetical protein